ncbi:ribonuclease III domain-containing protein [Thermoanaerobacter brockii subsp. lactiethylicus]|jgi:ribonuclease-3 family protein|uniref:Mini-ribonuclease 3 n=3 Tax=Thermoanaerobacter TaxID=1754 RepID=MRNC_THEPX|nr:MULTISPECIES: Mini-ribonuclease 3 [Thermoanaerobacter]B0K5F7.2 RecName: Full=Mini-ribonuclease 3; Short=Mini-3; Short=Mini-RNase 3; AltName: Full=Mini-RNase III; Short=Mini-III [Thermoanaerobacter sp. X514]KUJ90215.1 MAG: ribonuclease III [Thermoanaerobacter thermocopriae]ABY94023.1 ribonuclease III [Thermoanaerobacter pseudethanolicus ATCC 33223]ADV78979.1 ribonuclease III [Thermoanaerobacter brockii subsp. finnii Ako-1]MBZ4656325.1 ribonuclease [Thermoanaerobacter sp.]MDI3500412.1 mini-r
MEKSMMGFLENTELLTKEGVLSLSPLVLAFIGDAVYSLYIRTKIVAQKNQPVNFLHKETVKYVKAKAQAESVKRIYDLLSEEEKDIVRRGRNMKSNTTPKGVEVQAYRYATGFEALLGYLYLAGEFERLKNILELSVQVIEE